MAETDCKLYKNVECSNKLYTSDLINCFIATCESDRTNMSNGKFCPVYVNNTYTKALIDSGNTAGTCISMKFASKLGLTKDDLDSTPITIGTAKKGTSLTVFGKTKKNLKIQFGGLHKEFKFKPFVIKELVSDLNISLGFLEKHKIDQIHSKHCLKVQGKLVRLHDSPPFFLLRHSPAKEPVVF